MKYKHNKLPLKYFKKRSYFWQHILGKYEPTKLSHSENKGLKVPKGFYFCLKGIREESSFDLSLSHANLRHIIICRCFRNENVDAKFVQHLKSTLYTSV